MTRHKKSVWGLVGFLLIMVLGSAALGFWQLSRLEWKRGILSALQAAEQESSIDQLPDQELYHPYKISGLIDYTKPVFMSGKINPMAPKDAAARLGYDLYFPLMTEAKMNRRAIMVNFGWIDQSMRQQIFDNAKQAKVRPTKADISGWMISTPLSKPIFAPDNRPHLNQWYWIDPLALAEYTGYEIMPNMLYNKYNWFGSLRPSIADSIQNNHLKYAWTWFLVALTGFGFVLYFCYCNLVRKT